MSGAAGITDLVPSASNSVVYGKGDSAHIAGLVCWLLSTHEEPHRLLKSEWCSQLLKSVWLKPLRAAEHCRDVGLCEAQIFASSQPKSRLGSTTVG